MRIIRAVIRRTVVLALFFGYSMAAMAIELSEEEPIDPELNLEVTRPLPNPGPREADCAVWVEMELSAEQENAVDNVAVLNRKGNDSEVQAAKEVFVEAIETDNFAQPDISFIIKVLPEGRFQYNATYRKNCS